MEVKLDSLIERIKREGVEEANKKKDTIIIQAEKKAQEIIKQAQEKRETLIKNGEAAALRLQSSAEESLRQGSRDLLLSVRQEMIKLFDHIIKREVESALSADTLKKVLTHIASGFKKDGTSDIEVLLSKEDKKTLEGTFVKSLANELKKDVTLKVAPTIKNGFRVGQKGKDFYYDFTDEAIKEALGLYLNPRISEILKLKKKNGK